jgi:hypothetical protein
VTKYLSSEHWAMVLARAWTDDEFRKKVEMDPVKTINEEFGFEFECLFEIPNRPANLSEMDLTKMATGEEPVIAHMTI